MAAEGESESGGPRPLIERTLMFCDVERSTERWEADGASMRLLLEHHDVALTEVIQRHDGSLVKRTGDGAVAMFERSIDAVLAAIDVQHRLPCGPTDVGLDVAPIASRVGLHRGSVEPRHGDLHGPPMHRTARIMSAGHGGQVLVSKAVVDDLDPAALTAHGVSFEGRGLHRLKGLHEPEQISQVIAEGLQPEFPALVTQNASSGWMPVAAPRLIGREHELRTTPAMLEPARVVTLVGIGGVGKTSLAVHLAEAARPAFPDGVWFVDLASVTERHRVLPALADAAQLPVEGTATAESVVRHACRTRRMLLVVDNCEHLLADVSMALQRVLSASSTATVLCTSQRDLALANETVVRVEPLAHAVGVGAGSTTVPPSSELFVQQALLADPRFAPSADDLEVVQRICALLDGLPLALELAAARVRTMPLAAIAERLEASFDLLSSRDNSYRHRTLAAAIDWSTRLLEPADLRTLHSLAVFRGAFDWNGAAAVAGGDEPDVVDSLDELVRRSLVARTGRRFRLLAPMRLHCLAALGATGRLDECHERHARLMAASLPSPLDDPDATVLNERMDAILSGIDDLRAAYEWLVEHDPIEGARLALGLVDFWITRGRSREADEWLGRADVDAVPVAMRILVLGWMSAFSWIIGKNEQCEEAGRRAIALAAAAGLPAPPLAASRLSVVLAFTGHTADAVEVAELAEASLRAQPMSTEDPAAAVRVLGALAVVHAAAGVLPRAVVLADEAVALAASGGVATRMSALTNRMVITPTDPATQSLIVEISEMASVIGRLSARGHTALAAARFRLRAGDLGGYLEGLADYFDMMLATGEATFVRQGLESVPETLHRRLPREAAVFLGVVDRLADEIGLSGTDARLAELSVVRDHLRVVLGDDGLDAATAAGRALSMEEAVDHLRWLATHPASEAG